MVNVVREDQMESKNTQFNLQSTMKCCIYLFVVAPRKAIFYEVHSAFRFMPYVNA